MSGDVHEAVEAFDIEHCVMFLGNLTDDEKFSLYRLASVVAFPSLYEGFGLPPLEAMACGTPVVAASTASIPEVIGDAGILVRGYDERVWSDALTRATDDEKFKSELRQRGLQRSASFSWERAARHIAAILHEVTGK
jgi:glycosyltransferase involved in cell wall biosynthesis